MLWATKQKQYSNHTMYHANNQIDQDGYTPPNLGLSGLIGEVTDEVNTRDAQPQLNTY